MEIGERKYVSFVASGGGTKAWFFHVGVCLAFEEKGFLFRGGLKSDPFETDAPYVCDRYVGSSGGSIFCSLTASGFSPKQQAETYSRQTVRLAPGKLFDRRKEEDQYARELRKIGYFTGVALNRRFISDYFRALRYTDRLREGRYEALAYYLGSVSTPLSSRNIARYIHRALPTDDFTELAVDLNVITTINDPLGNMHRMVFCKDEYIDPRAGCYYKNTVPVSRAVAASCALPGLFAPQTVRVGGKKVDLIDGEIRKTLSTHVAKDKILRDKKLGGDADSGGLIIASYTHQPYHLSQKYGPLRKFGLPLNLQQAVYIAVSSRIDLARHYHDVKITVNEEVERFFKEKGYSEDDLADFLKGLNDRMNYDPKVDYIFVRPDPKDAGFFMGGNHFDLTASGVRHIVEKGYEAAVRKIGRYRFLSSAKTEEEAKVTRIGA